MAMMPASIRIYIIASPIDVDISLRYGEVRSEPAISGLAHDASSIEASLIERYHGCKCLLIF